MYRRLAKWRRVLATATSFTVFGVGGFLLATTVFPLLLVAIRNPERRQAAAQGLVCRSFGGFVLLLRWMDVASVEVRGAERLAAASGAVIIANHPTLLDVVIILAMMKRCQCVVKQSLLRNPFLGGVVRATGYIRNGEDAENVVREAARQLRSGASIVIFPEGTRTAPRQVLGPLQRGAANIAIEADAPLIPVVVRCNHDTLKKGSKWYDVPASRIDYVLEVGTPLVCGGENDNEQPRPLRARALTGVINNYFMDRLSA